LKNFSSTESGDGGRSQKKVSSVDPYTNQVLVEISGATAEDIDDAYQAAKKGQKVWAALTPDKRRDVFFRVTEILKERKEEIIDLLICETGSTRVKAEIEWGLVYQGTLEASTYPFRVKGEIIPTSIPAKEGMVIRQPVGVIGVISPWDFSLQLTNRSVAPALAAGNGVVLKPASSTPITGGLLFAEIYEKAGLPPGVLNVVVGAGSEIGDAFVENPIPKVITFTGSTEVGRHIGELCGRHLKKASLELGGNSPFVVLEDADIDQAVKTAVVGKFLNAGQICMAINRIIIVESIYDDIVIRFVDRVKSLKWGDPMDESVAFGPIIDKKQFDSIQKLVKQTIDAGAIELFYGPSDGLVMHPVVLSEVTNDMPAARSEIFGPVAILIRAKDEADALRIANDTEYGLSSAVFTGNTGRGFEFAKKLESGMSHVNDITINDEPNSPFGGEKNSGIGRFGGEWALREFTTEHWVTVQHGFRQYPF
jgi:aldehyde dehydrogenase (NAD+)